MTTNCHICNNPDPIFLFCQDCLGKNRAETFDARIQVIIRADKERKMKSLNQAFFLSKKKKVSIFEKLKAKKLESTL